MYVTAFSSDQLGNSTKTPAEQRLFSDRQAYQVKGAL